jgi:hypothetical protein
VRSGWLPTEIPRCEAPTTSSGERQQEARQIRRAEILPQPRRQQPHAGPHDVRQLEIPRDPKLPLARFGRDRGEDPGDDMRMNVEVKEGEEYEEDEEVRKGRGMEVDEESDKGVWEGGEDDEKGFTVGFGGGLAQCVGERAVGGWGGGHVACGRDEGSWRSTEQAKQPIRSINGTGKCSQ